MRVGLNGIELTGADVEIVARDVATAAMLYAPQNTGHRAPAMILCPGGIGAGDYEILEWLGGHLPEIGVAGLTIQWRGSAPEHDPDDISRAIDWLVAQPFIDPDRIGVMGMSRGGNAALRGAAFDSRLKLAITFGPATDFLQQAAGTKVYAPRRHQMLKDWLGDPEADRAYYQHVQAITHAAKIKQPLLMVHGLHDMHAVPEQSIWMKDAIEAGGNSDVRLELVPMMGHYGDLVPNGYGFDTLRAIMLPYLTERL